MLRGFTKRSPRKSPEATSGRPSEPAGWIRRVRRTLEAKRVTSIDDLSLMRTSGVIRSRSSGEEPRSRSWDEALRIGKYP